LQEDKVRQRALIDGPHGALRVKLVDAERLAAMKHVEDIDREGEAAPQRADPDVRLGEHRAAARGSTRDQIDDAVEGPRDGAARAAAAGGQPRGDCEFHGAEAPAALRFYICAVAEV